MTEYCCEESRKMNRIVEDLWGNGLRVHREMMLQVLAWSGRNFSEVVSSFTDFVSFLLLKRSEELSMNILIPF